ncbi:MAG TPA: D-alanine--D-alanine ligase [Aquiluna sp.]
MRVLILAGGISHERDVSLKSGRRVADALQEAGVEVEIKEPDNELIGHLIATRPDVVWSTLHGAVGEDGSLQDLMHLAQIRFVGASSDAARLAWNKPVAKTIAERAGLQTPQSISLPRSTFKELNAESVLAMVGTELGFPLVVKPAKSGSAQGVTKVESAKGFSKAMVDAFAYDDLVMVERFVAGTEVSVGVIDLGAGPIALPAVEIVPESGSFGYSERYTPGETDYFVPARVSRETSELLPANALAIFDALGLRHLSRIDFIVDDQGTCWFLEANVTPGMTETSLLPQAILAQGETLASAYSALARVAFSG